MTTNIKVDYEGRDGESHCAFFGTMEEAEAFVNETRTMGLGAMIVNIVVERVEQVRENAYRFHTSDGRDFGAVYNETEDVWDAEWRMDLIEGTFDDLRLDLETWLNG